MAAQPELSAVSDEVRILVVESPHFLRGTAHQERAGRDPRKGQGLFRRPSVEVLLNFNVGIFMRWGLGAFKRRGEIPEEEGEVTDAMTFRNLLARVYKPNEYDELTLS
jgi:hypothetical protein